MTTIASVNLWDRAVGLLGDEDKQLLDFTQTDKLKILADVLQATEQKKQLCLQKRWKYIKKNGDVVILRDLCEKAIKWVQKFKDIGDVAVQYDPTHASLPWAAVRFFLQLSVNDVQKFGAMLEGLETVAAEITRCHLYELYPPTISSARADLDLHLLRHYVDILKYLATARRYYTKSTIRRVGASVFETSDSVDDRLSKIAAERNDVERCARLIDSEILRGIESTANKTQASVSTLADDLVSLTATMSISQDVQYQSLKAMLASMDQPILRTAIQVCEIHTHLKHEERRKILAWLSTVKYREHHKTSFSAVMPGSGAWLRQKPEFIDWKTSSTSSILWIRGIPGSGKSKLMSTIVQSMLDDKNQNIATSALAYFYCTRDEAEKARADPDEILRAVLKQLSCFSTSQPIHPAVLHEFRKREIDADEDGSDPSRFSLPDCQKLILEMADQLPLVVIIDALDECDPLRRHELLAALKDIVQKSNNLIKVIVSSRNDSDIVCRLNDVPNVYIDSDDNGVDVDRFVEQELGKAIDERRLLQGNVSSSLRQRILGNLKGRANGMFLWARLQIQNLCDPERMIIVRDIEDALHQLPVTLSELYGGILGRIDRIAPHGRLLAKRILRWLLCAGRPLDPLTMVQMLQSVETNNSLGVEEILALCCNLVVLDDSLNVFRFGHASVREYLELQSEFSSQDNNLRAATECLQCAFRDPTDHSLENFEEYAAACWVHHYHSLAYEFRITQPISGEFIAFFVRGRRGEAKAEHWIEQALELKRFAGGYNHLLHAASRLDLPEVLEPLLDIGGVDVDGKDWSDKTCLYQAVGDGFRDIVNTLLTKGANPNIGNGYKNHVALRRAAKIGHEQIALLLLQHGADFTIRDHCGMTALDLAVKRDDEALVRLLVLNGCCDEAQQRYGQLLIEWATSNSTSKVSSVLHRGTGYVGVAKGEEYFRAGCLAITVQLMYSLLPFCDLLSKMAADQDQTSTSNALKRLFTDMESSTSIVSAEELITSLLEEPGILGLYVGSLKMPFVQMAHFLSLLNAKLVKKDSGDFQDIAKYFIPWTEITNSSTFYFKAWSFDIDGKKSFKEVLEANNKGFPGFDTRWCSVGRWPLGLVGHLPRIMVFELNRYAPAAYTSGLKIYDRCTYPASMVIDRTKSNKITYVLHSVIAHRGYAKNHPDDQNFFLYLKSHNTGRWVLCEHELVRWATEEEVFENNFGSGIVPELDAPDVSSVAVGLIYIREDKISEIARVMVPRGEPPSSP
ncbi:MAG: hypothetical protein Q9168_007498 [Polycauliona sp. 1 TL-2023]